jgi:hypothetical protein
LTFGLVYAHMRNCSHGLDILDYKKKRLVANTHQAVAPRAT